MTRLNGTLAAAVLVAATLAFGGCGGDDEGDKSTSGAGAVETTTGTTGTTEDGTTRERTGTTEDRTDTTNTRESGDDNSGGGGSGTSGGGSKDDSGSAGGGGESGSKSEELTAANAFSTAKTVCRNFLPKALEKDLKDGDKDAADIAKDYSRGFPGALRKRAYAGCLAGLKGKG